MFSGEFISLLKESVGEKRAAAVLEALGGDASVSIRLNPSKLRECPFEGAEEVPWSPWGYILGERPNFTLDPLFHAGAYYVQDSSAMMVGELFRRVLDGVEPGVNVLDLCAAPGGKSTDLAASARERFGDAFSLLSNEVMQKRFCILRDNLDSWGDPRTAVISRDPSAFGSHPLFDIVLADVPCSGEGMFRKDSRAVEEWSEDTVRFCAARTRRILLQSWGALREGGFLIYSTCTFNHYENDDTVAWIASELGASVFDAGDIPGVERTLHGHIMLPGLVPGEGQYAAVLRKNGERDSSRRGDALAFPGARCTEPLSPDAPRVELSREDALRYLHGDVLRLGADAPIGPVTLCFKGLALGPGKNLGTRCNNLYPKAKRIRMDIR